MNIILALSTVSLSFQVAATLAALAIARAPGWRRVRVVAALAFTAGLYSLFDLLGALYTRGLAALAWVTSANLTVAAAHVGVWTWFSFSDDEGSWRSVPRRLRLLVIAHVALTAALALAGGAIDDSRTDLVSVPALHVEFVQPYLTPLASLSAAVTLGLVLLSFVAQVRQAREGVRGANWIAVGFVIFIAFGLLEVAIAMGLLDFIYVAELGYLALVIPVLAQFVRRFTDDAHRLQALTDRLGEEVARKTAELDTARETLATEARFTALGRMAGGVAHEINNPLQVLTVRLEELAEELPPGPSEARDAVEQSIAATARIERIVEGMRAYARPPAGAAERVAPAELVRAAMERVRPQADPSIEVRFALDSAPYVLVDRDRVVGAIVHAVLNASVAVTRAGASGRRIDLVTRRAGNGDALIEIRDTGPGFPPDLLPRLGEPFLTTRPTQRSAGLGLFIMRGVIDAQGGSLELENAPEGGAVVRIRLSPASG